MPPCTIGFRLVNSSISLNGQASPIIPKVMTFQKWNTLLIHISPRRRAFLTNPCWDAIAIGLISLANPIYGWVLCFRIQLYNKDSQIIKMEIKPNQQRSYKVHGRAVVSIVTTNQIAHLQPLCPIYYLPRINISSFLNCYCKPYLALHSTKIVINSKKWQKCI